ncbi:MAG: C-GCAxxG-C-C family protein [Magnetospirillum sp.]|nr:C-GCAxxG-C-C family protein [Magnetospirillum sp.]MCR6632462.1 C-GCAxxG-C-C family protein [Magnetospirillum sp.]
MTDSADANSQAIQRFKEGLYCAESVLATLASRLGIDNPQVPAIATGFCSGLSQTAGPCGALTGAVMGLGLAFGRNDGTGSVQRTYEAVQTLVERFTEEFGATGCADLLGCHLGTAEGRQTFTDNKLHRRCMTYTGRAAELAAQLIGNDASTDTVVKPGYCG